MSLRLHFIKHPLHHVSFGFTVESSDMQPNWEMAKSLYGQRVPLSVIVAECGVGMDALKKRIQRGAWRAQRNQTREIALANGKSNLHIKSEIIKNAIVDEVIADLGVVQEKPSKTLKDVERKQSVLSSMAGTAEKCLGWSGGVTNNNMISISNLESCSLESWVDTRPRDEHGKPIGEMPKVQAKADDVFVYHDEKGQPHECDFFEFAKRHPESVRNYIPPPPVTIDAQVIQSESTGNGHVEAPHNESLQEEK